MNDALLEKLANMAARLELLEHVVARLMEHERSPRFDEFREFAQRSGVYYDNYATLEIAQEGILDSLRDTLEQGENDA